jgi:dTDP-4-dehydrorhamnose 3,5-epimerase
MNVTPVQRIDGALLIRFNPHVDERGFFCRTFDADVMRAAGIDPSTFVQDSVSRSAGGVVRGLHVRNWESFKLHAEEHVSLYVPAGCAHGFQAVTDPADVYYRIDRVHDPAEDVTIAFDDPDLAIPWPRPVTLMSERDRQAPGLAVAMTSLT